MDRKYLACSPLRRLAPLFFVFMVWALIITYPLVLHPFSHIPRGDEPTGTVPLFNLWTLQWNIDQLMQGYPNYWNAPIFAPGQGTFAFSEIQPVTAFLAAPLWLSLQSPAFGYNAVVILFITLNGWFGFCLLKSWGASNLAALLTGLIMQSLPFVAQEMGVLQLIAIFGYLWSLFFLTRILAQIEKQGRFQLSTGLGLALGLPVTFFTCGYYGLFSVLFLPLLVLLYLKRLNWSIIKHLALVLVLSAALTLPILLMQYDVLSQHGFTRSAQTIKNNSARPVHYLQFLDRNLLYGQLLGFEPGSGQRLFTGLALVLLAALGLAGPNWRRIKLYLGLAALLAMLVSFGLRLQIGSLQPYQWLQWSVPGFAQLRSPFRFAALVQIHLALLAGFGLVNLKRWRPKKGGWLGGLWAVFIVFESLAWPLPLQAVPALQTTLTWQAWLNGQPQPATIVLLPFAAGSRAADFEQTTRWMLQNRWLNAAMLNGYSGFFPPDHARLRKQATVFPSHQSIDYFRQMGVDFVVIDHNLAQTPPAGVVRQYAAPVFTDSSNVSIYALTQP